MRPESLVPIGSEQALDEIAARLADNSCAPRPTRHRHLLRHLRVHELRGARGRGWLPPASAAPSFYTSVTIDQPAKVYTWSRVGAWLGGPQAFSQSHVTMMIGNNPLTSHYAWQGSVPPFRPRAVCAMPRRAA